MKFRSILAALLIPFACFSAEYVTTNLNDSLHTEITYDAATNIDIRLVEIRSLDIDLTISNKFSLTWCSPRKLSVEKLDAAQIVVEKVEVEYLTPEKVEVELLSPGKVEVADAHSAKLLVVDNSMFKVFWSADTFAELDQMKKAYQFGASYGGSGSPRMKDLEKLYGFSNLQMYYKWLNKLWDNKTLEISKIKPTGLFKLIGEAWIYSNKWDQAVKEQFERNLQWTKAKGYDAVLVRFDCNEDMTNLLEMIQVIRSKSMKVFSVYVGRDNTCPRWNPYIDPDKLEPFFKTIAAKSDGYILGWRETSTHVRLMPNEFFNYLCKMAREANPNILLYGEIYYGYTSSSAGRRALFYNIPKNVTGVVVQNMGFVGYNHGYIVQQLFKNIVPNYKTYDKIFQVVGSGPYYRTKNGHNGAYIEDLSIEEEYKTKRSVENSFKRYGAKTLTLLHDGVDDNFTFLVADPNDMKHWNDTTDNLLYDTTLTK